MTESYLNTLSQAQTKLSQSFDHFFPHVAVILGSGLGEFSNLLSDAKRVSYQDIPGFRGSEVVGHASEVIYGKIGTTNVLVFSGRMHGYEGNDLQTVTLPVRMAGSCGAKHLIVTNAAGGIGDGYEPGDFMLIKDQINFTGQNAVYGPNLSDFGPRFHDMSEPFDQDHRKTFQALAHQDQTKLHEGVYIGVLGSSYETKAEIRAFKLWGAHAVGMSTVHEVTVARHQNLRVLGVSMISNKAAGLSDQSITHQEVIEITQKRGKKLAELLHRWIELQGSKLQ